MPEEIVERVVTEVKDGWITFASPGDPADTFRVTAEVHLTVVGKKPTVGDTHRFRLTPANLEGKRFHYYVQEAKGSGG